MAWVGWVKGSAGQPLVSKRVVLHNRQLQECCSYMGLCHRRLSTGGEAYEMERNTCKHITTLSHKQQVQ